MCVAAIAAVAWPVHSLRAGVTGDWSWHAGLAYVAEHGLRFGDQIAWTYGPLGFLNTWFGPVLYYGDILLMSWVYIASLQVLLTVALLRALRRSLPLPVAALVAAVVLALTRDLATALGFAWCVQLVTRDDGESGSRVTAGLTVALGVLTGLMLLGKLNQGVELLALAVVLLLVERRLREVLLFAGALLVTATAGWVATNQTLSEVWPYVRNGVEVVAGYAAAMGATDPEHAWSYAAALALVGLTLALGWGATKELSRRRRLGLLGLYAIYAGASFKEGFVRQDPGHLEVFFGDMLVPLAFVPFHGSRRTLTAALAGIAAGTLVLAGLLGTDRVVRRLNPYANIVAVADQMRTLGSSDRRAAMIADLRTRIEATYGLTPGVRAAVGQRPVMLWPNLFGEVAWAYDLNLRPLPSFEVYGAYTPALDRLGARMLASSRAPARILRTNVIPVDRRRATFEAPFATQEIFCRYRQITVGGAWQVLARASDRCGTPQTLSTLTAAWGEPVSVPAPLRAAALVLVHIEGAGPHGRERVRSLLLRPQIRWIALDGNVYRLVAATAADGLLLYAPPQLDYPDPFAMAPRPQTIVVGRSGGEPGGYITYRFEEVPLRPIPAVATAG
jgi:hypothetical protein